MLRLGLSPSGPAGHLPRSGGGMTTPEIIFGLAVFLLAGTVKGLVGLGLPTITIALTSLVLPLPEAIALIALPTIFSNIWQAAVGGRFWIILRRQAPLIVPLMAVLYLTLWLVGQKGPNWAFLVLAVVLVVYSALGLLRIRLHIHADLEKPLAPLIGKRILLIVAGGIAAFKSLELIRRLRERGAAVRCVVTEAGARFVTPLSMQALSEDRVFSDMFSLTDESEMGHIELSREADLLVVAPATANLLARMAAGMADDLAATVLLATDKPVLAAPAMNVRMWTHPATVANVETLKKRGVSFVGPNDGAMACNEYGPGRMSEPEEIVAAIEGLLAPQEKPLAGKRAVVTSGPTREAIDPVRYISNHSSGKQGHAIASALA